MKSCNSFSAGQLLILREVEQRTGKPAAFIETDLVDPRYFSPANIKNRLESYLQMIEQKAPAPRGMHRDEETTMSSFIGIDLGSTTTKAVLLDENQHVLGRGITNSRSNYGTAAQIARTKPRSTRAFTASLRRSLDAACRPCAAASSLRRLSAPSAWSSSWSSSATLRKPASASCKSEALRQPAGPGRSAAEVFRRVREEAPELFAPGAKRKSDFFRDIAGSRFLPARDGGRGGGRAATTRC